MLGLSGRRVSSSGSKASLGLGLGLYLGFRGLGFTRGFLEFRGLGFRVRGFGLSFLGVLGFDISSWLLPSPARGSSERRAGTYTNAAGNLRCVDRRQMLGFRV